MPTHERWEQRWQEQNTPWDAGCSPPALVELLSAADRPPPGRALVPGCGAGYDVITLAQHGFTATGLEVASSARKPFEELKANAGDVSANLVITDFFRFEETFDLVWDYTFLCALDLPLRSEWATAMSRLVTPGGELSCLVFPIWDKPKDQGPPYPVTPGEVTNLLSPWFRRTYLAPPKSSHGPRTGFEQLARFIRE